MFSLGWMEISIILIITVIVVGPKEIPTVIKFIKGITSGLGKISREFKSTVNEISHLEEVKDIKKDILDTKESIVKEGKELDEFIEKSNDEIMKGEKNDRSVKCNEFLRSHKGTKTKTNLCYNFFHYCIYSFFLFFSINI